MKIPFQMSKLTVTCANMSELLFKLNVSGVVLHHVCMIDELTASFYIRQNQMQTVVDMIERFDGKIIRFVPASGNMLLKGVLKRPALIVGVVLLLILTVVLPARVLFITVVGNEKIPQKQILEAASECGVYFGISRREIRSEKVKNRLLSAICDLEWVGVNTSGCVAQISVRERTSTDRQKDMPMVSSLVASCDGVIREVVVRSGSTVCRTGQAVKKGQLLISGYSDCGRCIYGTRADGEIYAQTKRSLKTVALSDAIHKEQITGIDRKYGLIIGKKRINFYKGSGISGTTCVRMYREYPLTLPGGLRLPFALTVQEEYDYVLLPLKTEQLESETVLLESARNYLESQMVAGRVIQEDYRVIEADGALYMVGQYICDEMIGQTRCEEIANYYE